MKKILYIDCHSGASGDMLLGALLDLPQFSDASQYCPAWEIDGEPVAVRTSAVIRGAFQGRAVHIDHSPQHKHRHLQDIIKIIASLTLPTVVRDRVVATFRLLGEAEAKMHGTSIDRVHFHEVGAIDSIMDIVLVTWLIELLAVDKIVCSPVPVGNGTVTIAHGVVGVPAPATAHLLQGAFPAIPIVTTLEPVGELLTPTGAALLRSHVHEYGALPTMIVKAIGYGAGSRDIPGRANILRMFLGEELAETVGTDTLAVITTTVDDVTGERIGYVLERLREAGCCDAYTTAVQMKKDRPGSQVTVLCWPDDIVTMEGILFRELGTLGVRREAVTRPHLRRRPVSACTPYGEVRGKVATYADQVFFSPEYESLRKVALLRGVPLAVVEEEAKANFYRGHYTEVTDGQGKAITQSEESG